MSTFRDCLISAVEQGAISKEEAADLGARFDERFAQERLALGDDAAAAAAKAALEKELAAEAMELRRRALLADAARGRILTFLQGYRTPDGKADVFEAALSLFENFGNGTAGVRQRTEALVAMTHGEMADVLQAFRRSGLSGRHRNKPLQEDVVRELHGQGTGSAEARVLAEAVRNGFEALRQRFNAAGGAIAKLENYFPHAHDAGAVIAAGREKWLNFIRPLLSPEKMRDPLTGEALTPARLDQLLNGSYDAIITGGWAHREPGMQPQGRGALANQRQDHRFLVFRDADAWLDYNRQFGGNDPMQAMFNHVNGMARDIATMEVLGPNPGGMVEWLKQMVAREFADHQAGKPSLYRAGNELQEVVGGNAKYLMNRIDQVYSYQRGREVISDKVAGVAGTLRNLATSAFLGAASLLAVPTDPIFDALARYRSGLPILPAFTAILKTFDGQTREQAVRSGLIWDDFLHIMRDEARFTTISTGAAEWSKWLADRTLTWGLLSPITQARRHLHALEWQGVLADQAGNSFDMLPERLRMTMEGYGITAMDWDAMRATPLYSADARAAGFLRPVDIAATNREAAEKLLALIHGQLERAVPQGTIRSRSIMLAGKQRGTIPAEFMEMMLQFKSFGLSFTAMQIDAVQRELARGKGSGAAYASAMVISLTIGGAIGIQLSNLFQGRDPQPMNDAKFIMAAAMRGGGFGLFGDFMFADLNRFGRSVLENVFVPPAANIVGDFVAVPWKAGQAALQGKETKMGKDAVQFLRRNTPVLSSLWQVRAAYNRVLLDQLQYLVDPDAHRAFRDQQRRFERETGGSFYWQPGEPLPDRAPTLDRLTK